MLLRFISSIAPRIFLLQPLPSTRYGTFLSLIGTLPKTFFPLLHPNLGRFSITMSAAYTTYIFHTTRGHDVAKIGFIAIFSLSVVKITSHGLENSSRTQILCHLLERPHMNSRSPVYITLYLIRYSREEFFVTHTLRWSV